MTDETRIDSMEEPQEVKELEDEELGEVAGGMFPAAMDGGESARSAPIDVCKTPVLGAPVPMPLPNVGTTKTSGTKTGSKTGKKRA